MISIDFGWKVIEKADSCRETFKSKFIDLTNQTEAQVRLILTQDSQSQNLRCRLPRARDSVRHRALSFNASSCAHGWRCNRAQEASSGHRGFLLRNVDVLETGERILKSRRHLNGVHQHGQDGPVPHVGEPQFSFDVLRLNGSRREQDEEDVGTFDAADNLRLPTCAGLNSGPVDPYLVSSRFQTLGERSTSDASCLE